MSIHKINLTEQIKFKVGKKYKFNQGCLVDNVYYQSLKDNNTDHPLMGRSWRQVLAPSRYLLSSTTEVLSSSSLPNSTSTI